MLRNKFVLPKPCTASHQFEWNKPCSHITFTKYCFLISFVKQIHVGSFLQTLVCKWKQNVHAFNYSHATLNTCASYVHMHTAVCKKETCSLYKQHWGPVPSKYHILSCTCSECNMRRTQCAYKEKVSVHYTRILNVRFRFTSVKETNKIFRGMRICESKFLVNKNILGERERQNAGNWFYHI